MREVKTIACLVLVWGIATLNGCGKPGGSDSNVTNSFVTVVSINNNEMYQSDILTEGYPVDDPIDVAFMSTPRNLGEDDIYPHSTDIDGVSPFDAIVFHSYHVSHIRSDGGPNPPDFTMGFNFTLLPDTGESQTATIVIVRALDKGLSPLKELRDRGQIVTTTTITFYGEDGYGNDIVSSGSLIISFANFIE